MNYTTVILASLGSFAGFLWGFWYWFVISIRINEATGSYLAQQINQYSHVILSTTFCVNKQHPSSVRTYCYLKDTGLIEIKIEERVLQAGWKSTQVLVHITCARWNYQKVFNWLQQIEKDRISSEKVLVEFATPHGGSYLGTLNPDIHEPYVPKEKYKDLENDIINKINKTGAILYGPPGNGKTSLIRYLALKYKIPVHILLCDQELTNRSLTQTFAYLPERCILLIEDFDRIFDKRKCLLPGSSDQNNTIKFSFDSFLNGFDGIYNNYKGIIFIITANDLNKIDDSLKNRPSRFKHIIEIEKPTEEIRRNILQNEELVKLSDGLSLDQILKTKETGKLTEIYTTKEDDSPTSCVSFFGTAKIGKIHNEYTPGL